MPGDLSLRLAWEPKWEPAWAVCERLAAMPRDIAAARAPRGRRSATPSDWLELLWEQEAAGSNPAIPTAIFRMYGQSCVRLHAGDSA